MRVGEGACPWGTAAAWLLMTVVDAYPSERAGAYEGGAGHGTHDVTCVEKGLHHDIAAAS